MESELLIKYSGVSTEKGFDLSVLGNSFIGFNSLLKSLFELSRIQGDLDVRTQKIEEGSIDVLVSLHLTLVGVPFKDVAHLLDFLQAVRPDLLHEARAFFSALDDTVKTVDAYLNAHQFEADLMAGFIIYLIGRQQERKRYTPDNMPKHYAKGLDRLRAKKAFKRALQPLSETGFSEIKVISLNSSEQKSATISEDSLEAYLPEDEQILPEMKNGQTVQLVGTVVGLQSTHGEVVKIRVQNIESRHSLLVAHPPYGTSAEVYKDLYGAEIILKAEVVRKNLYKRPELNIIEASEYQTSLLEE